MTYAITAALVCVPWWAFFGGPFGNDSGPFRVPIRLVFQHRPAHDGDLAGQSNRRFLLACFLATVDAVVGRSRSFVVSQAYPGTFHEYRPQ